MSISLSSIPLLPVNTATTGGFAQVYLFHDILNDLEPGLGDDYLAQYPDVTAWSQTQLPQFESSLQSALDSAATAIADGIQASNGNVVPLTVDAVARGIETAVPDAYSDLVKSILDSLGGKLKGMDLGGGVTNNNSTGGGAIPGSPDMGGGGAGGANGQINGGNNQISPLVLDLTGTGLNLTPLSSVSPYFDMSNDGFARKTGWIGSGTGLLVLPNADGSVSNITDLFGNQTGSSNGFAALGIDDANNDGVINSSDAIYSQLRVWVDTDGDGVAETGELYTLADLGITSINLTATSSDQTVAGNSVKYISSYTLSDNTTREIADVWFNTSPTYTKSDTAVTISSTIAALPQLNGYGTISDLQSAMMSDSTLATEVGAFSELSSSTGAATIQSDVEQIMYEWGAATDPASYYSGSGIDPSQALFVENYTGITFNYSAFSGPRQADNIAQAWTDAFDATEARLVLQSPVAAQVPEFTYDSELDAVLPVNDLATSFADAYTRLGAVSSTNINSWILEDQVANAFQMDLNVSQSSFAEAIAAGSNDTIASVANAVAHDIAVSFASNGSIIETGVDLGSTFYAGSGINKIVMEGAGSVPSGATTWQNTSDTVYYNSGDGALELDGEGDAADTNNTLAFGPGITSTSLSLSQSGNNLVITDGVIGDQITLDNMLTTSYDNGLDTLTFADDSSLTNYQLDSLVLATGSATHTSLSDSLGNAIFDSKGLATIEDASLSQNNTFVYNSGYGALEIVEEGNGGNVLQFGSGILPSQISVTSDSSDDLIVTDGTTGDQIKLDDMLGNYMWGVQSVEFANATSLTKSQLISMATTGSVTNTSINDDLGNATFDAAGYVHSISTTSGNNTYIYNSGYGSLYISNDDYSSSPNNTLQFGSSISESNVSVSEDGSGNVYLADGISGDQIELYNMLNNSRFGLQNIEFSDGTTWTEASVEARLVTAGNTVIDSGGTTDYEREVSTTNYTYDYNIGYGALEIFEYNYGSSPSDVLKFGAGILPSDLTFSTDSSYDLTVKDGTTGDVVTLDYMFNGSGFGLQQFQFADGTVWTLPEIEDKAATGSVGNTTLYDEMGGVTFDPAGYASLIKANGSGNNTFLYNQGYGSVEITDYDSAASPNNTLKFGAGITASQISITADSYGNVYMTDGTAGDQVELDYMKGSSNYGAQTVEFSDNTTWNTPTLVNLQLGTSGDNTLTGTSGNDTFYSSAGNDSMVGSGGYDTYKIGLNVGTTTIQNYTTGGSAASGEVDFLAGMSDESLWFKQNGNDLEVDILGTSNKVTVSGWFGSNVSSQVESFSTADGLKLDTQVSQLVSAMATYSSNNSGFNPATATAMPTDATLQGAITTAWHS